MFTTIATTTVDLEDLIGPRVSPRAALEAARVELERRRPSTARPWESLGFRMKDGDDDDSDSDSDDDDSDDDDSDDDDGDDEDDDDVSDLAKAQAAAAKYRREARDARRDLAAKNTADEKAQGKHKERADRLEKELEERDAKDAERRSKDLLTGALRSAGFKDGKLETGVKLAKADELLADIEDEHDAKRVARRLAKENPELVDKRPRNKRRDEDDDEPDTTRRRRRDRDDDDEDDDDSGRRNGGGKKKLRGTDRIKAHFDEADKRSRRGS